VFSSIKNENSPYLENFKQDINPAEIGLFSFLNKLNFILEKMTIREKLELFRIISNSRISMLESILLINTIHAKYVNAESLKKLEQIQKHVMFNFHNSEILKTNGGKNKEWDESSLKPKEEFSENKNSRRAWLCQHLYRTHYARGKCRNCYLSFFNKVIFYCISYF
jgi:hypothetical protein